MKPKNLQNQNYEVVEMITKMSTGRNELVGESISTEDEHRMITKMSTEDVGRRVD